MKIIIFLLIAVVLYCLGSGMVFLLKDIDSKRMVKALSWRVGVSLALFALLFVGYYFGLLHPHGVYPAG